MANIPKLKSILLTTGLQNKDNPLYQLLWQLITELNDVNNTASSISVITNSGPQGPAGAPGFVFDDNVSGDENTIPGPAGIRGIDGASVIGPPGEDGLAGEDGFGFPGANGADGANGMVPYYIATGETFIVPLYKQALFSMNIDNNGTLEIDGFLIEVD